MIPHRLVPVRFREQMPAEFAPFADREGAVTLKVVEVGFSTYVDSITNSWVELKLAEAAIRAPSAAGMYERRVLPGFLDLLADDSAAEVVRAANELNQSPARSKKALALIQESLERISVTPTPSSPSAASPSS